jgi:hypothetical protein
MPSRALRSAAGCAGRTVRPTAVARSPCSPTRGFAALAATAPGHVETVRSAILDTLDADQIRRLGEISETLARRLT